MKVKSKFAALSSIQQVDVKVKGRVYVNYQADLGVFDGRRIRITRSSKAECQRAVEAWFRQRAVSGDAVLQLTPVQLADAVMAFDALRRANVHERLSDIVRDRLAQLKEVRSSVTVAEAYAKYFERFTEDQVSQRQICTARTGKFAEAFAGRMVCDIDAKTVRDWLDSHESWSPTTWNGNMTYVKSFLEWCCRKTVGYLRENPICDMEKKTVKTGKIEVIHPDDLAKLMRAVVSEGGDYFDFTVLHMTLGFFCGMRTAEIERQREEDIRLDADTIVVSEAKGMQSGGRGRSFAIPETAKAWLQSIDIRRAYRCRLTESGYGQAVKRIAKSVGVELPKNVARHSFITYHIAAYGNPGLTEGVAGTSDTMRKRHYDAIGLKKEALAYFAVTPGAVISGLRSGAPGAPAPCAPASPSPCAS